MTITVNDVEPPGRAKDARQPTGAARLDGKAGVGPASWPSMFVVFLGGVVALSQAAHWTGFTPLHASGPSVAVILICALATWKVFKVDRGRNPRLDFTGAALVALPGLGVWLAALAGLMRGEAVGAEWNLNGDHPRHAVHVAETWLAGNLDYDTSAYPRGWHSFVALLWQLVGAELGGDGLRRLIAISAFASLTASALLTMAVGHLGSTLALKAHRSAAVATSVGLCAASLAALPTFLANYQALGYQTSLVAALAFTAALHELLSGSASWPALVTTGSAVVIVAHTWQLLMPAAMAVFGMCVVARIRSRRLWGRPTAVIAAVAAFSASGMVAAITQSGVAAAASSGPDSPVPLGLLGGGLLAVFLVAGTTSNPTVRFAGVAVAIPAATALGICVVFKVPLLHYYPSKLLWVSALSALPWLGVAAALITKRFRGTHPVVTRLRGCITRVGIALLLIYALLMPWGSQLGAWSTVRGDRVLSALSAPGAVRATVVWLQDSPTTDSVTRSYLDVLRVAWSSDRHRAPQARLTVAQECALLRADHNPVILTSAAADEALARYSCAPHATVLRVTADQG